MLNRVIGIVTLMLALAANTALLLRDVCPEWISGEPPRPIGLVLEPNTTIRSQLGIFDEREQRLGWSWTLHRKSLDGQVTTRTATVILERVLHGIPLPGMRVDSNLHYTATNDLDRLAIDVIGLPVRVEVKGEHVPPDQFPCSWSVTGEMVNNAGTFLLSSHATRALGDALRPFDGLTNLHVGQTWQLQLVNPLAGQLPGLDAGYAPEAIRARVTSRVALETEAGSVDAFIIEAERLRAWVAVDGRVLRQELDVPVLGRLILRDEPYDERAYQETMDGPPVGKK